MPFLWFGLRKRVDRETAAREDQLNAVGSRIANIEGVITSPEYRKRCIEDIVEAVKQGADARFSDYETTLSRFSGQEFDKRLASVESAVHALIMPGEMRLDYGSRFAALESELATVSAHLADLSIDFGQLVKATGCRKRDVVAIEARPATTIIEKIKEK